ncbi:conserved hypothetical protein [Prochlorococcus marinus str. MIT 9312]|uniref:Uncharacterized protein n=1 Tax=Prochlorococcus marinus (strain MIT 9312) TaxID=74546 RepID=Q31BI7_PROM9|nr:hypothetical protein [Prochlorococcus marinus]ABB49758.1 conserved hypothetical protein [Prochlorococcus marinus str. MIT 9312]KGF99269.1 hypothetical protein EU97_1827 [Prochlorococcus marinus str. MIT 9311]
MIKVNPAKWEYLRESILKRKLTKICITCNHFLYSTTETFATVLICPRYEKRIPQDDHLLKGCENWQKIRTILSPKLLNYSSIKFL